MDDLVAVLFAVELLLLTDEDLDDVLRDTEAFLLVRLLVPMPFLTEVPLLVEETALRLPVEPLTADLMRLPSVCARKP